MNALEIIAWVELVAFFVLIGANVVLFRDYRRFLRQMEEVYAIMRGIQEHERLLLDAIIQGSGKEQTEYERG